VIGEALCLKTKIMNINIPYINKLWGYLRKLLKPERESFLLMLILA